MNPIFLKQYEFGPFRLDSAERRLLREGEPVPLSPKVFDLLLVLVRRPGQILENEGLYFAGADSSDRPAINFFNFSTSKAAPVMAFEKGLPLGGPGLSVSPDGRWMLFSQVDRRGSDIMLLENFR
jgi:hypothetical protein